MLYTKGGIDEFDIRAETFAGALVEGRVPVRFALTAPARVGELDSRSLEGQVDRFTGGQFRRLGVEFLDSV